MRKIEEIIGLIDKEESAVAKILGYKVLALMQDREREFANENKPLIKTNIGELPNSPIPSSKPVEKAKTIEKPLVSLTDEAIAQLSK